MLSRRAVVTVAINSGPRSRRMALPPRGSGSPVRSNHHGAVFIAYASAAIHKRVFFLDIWIGMEGDSADIVEPFHRFAIERFDIGERVVELQAGHANLVRSQAIEHESIIRIRAVGN